MCKFHESTCNGFGDIWWTDNPIYFSSIDVVSLYLFVLVLFLELRTQNSLFRSVQPGDSTLRLIGVAIMRVTFCDIHYSLLMQFT